MTWKLEELIVCDRRIEHYARALSAKLFSRLCVPVVFALGEALFSLSLDCVQVLYVCVTVNGN
jgi:hypothetical protein